MRIYDHEEKGVRTTGLNKMLVAFPSNRKGLMAIIMKRKLIMFITAAVITAPAAVYAENGDIAGTIYTTDILTQIDGRSITSYNIDGETLIALEDLSRYGFNVTYNDSVRAVFINQTGDCPADFKPLIERGRSGGIAGYYYESDIKAFVNGTPVTAYSLNGKMAAKVEELGGIYEQDVYGYSQCLMTFEYDDSKRLLSLSTARGRMPQTDVIKSDFKNQPDDGFWQYIGEIPIDGGCILIDGTHGTSHGSYTYYTYLGDDGLYISLTPTLGRGFGFSDMWGHLTISDVKADGDCITFSGSTLGGTSGSYRFNPRTSELRTVEETYDPSLDYYSYLERKNVFNKPLVTSDVKVTIDGIGVTAYHPEGTDCNFIDASVFDRLGYTVTETPDERLYLKSGSADAASFGPVTEPGVYAGMIESVAADIAINGRAAEVYSAGGRRLINVDSLWSAEYGKGTWQYEMYTQYGASDYGISGSYDAASNTLTLTTDGVHADFQTLKETAKALCDGRTDVTVKTAADNERIFAIQYLYDHGGADGYLIKSDGTVLDLISLSSIFHKFDFCGIETDGDVLIMRYSDGSEKRLDTVSMEFTE